MFYRNVPSVVIVVVSITLNYGLLPCFSSAINQALGNNEYHTISASAITMEDATKFAKDITQAKLAAIVNINEAITTYFWKGELVQEKQYLLMILTHESKRTLVGDYIRKNHGHVEPGLYSYVVADFSKTFLDWIDEMLEINGTHRQG